MMDFDKKAREILHFYRRQDMSIDVVEQNIAAALKAAYNEGLEDGKDAGRVNTLSLLSQAMKKPI